MIDEMNRSMSSFHTKMVGNIGFKEAVYELFCKI